MTMFKNLFKSKSQTWQQLSWKNKDVTIVLDNGHGKGCVNGSPKWPDGS